MYLLDLHELIQFIFSKPATYRWMQLASLWPVVGGQCQREVRESRLSTVMRGHCPGTLTKPPAWARGTANTGVPWQVLESENLSL